MITRSIARIAFLTFFAFIGISQAEEPLDKTELKKAGTILFLGDSITYSGTYVAYFDAWLRTEFPKQTPKALNAGVPSETVSGLSEPNHANGKFPRPDLAERLDRVLATAKPDLIFACYGMNCGIQQPLDPERFAAYQKGILSLKEKAEASGVDIIFVTPPIYDAQRNPNKAFYREVLDHYSTWLISQRKEGLKVIDLHFPMQAALDAERKNKPAFTFQKDAVHPDQAGHRIMALSLIRAFDPKFSDKEFESDSFKATFAPAMREMIERRNDILTRSKHRRPGILGYEAK